MRQLDWMRGLRGCLCAVVLLATPPALAQDPASIIGAEDQNQGCITCHALEVEAWQTTRHFATFKDRHRSEEAKKILGALGIRSMKRAEDCNQCHYTSQESAGRVRAISGVSCESCHGAGRPWIEVHQKIGGDPEPRPSNGAPARARAPPSVRRGSTPRRRKGCCTRLDSTISRATATAATPYPTNAW